MQECYLTFENRDKKNKEWLKEICKSTHIRDFPISTKSTAFLIIDMQEYFLNKASHAYIKSSQVVKENILCLMNTMKKANILTVSTKHAVKGKDQIGLMGKWWGDPMLETNSLTRVKQGFESEYLIKKNRYSAFYNTDLENILKRKNIDTLIIGGLTTHLCCETTARDAFMRDFLVFFLIDGTCSFNEDLHVASLKTLSNGFVIPITTESLIERINYK